MIWGRRQQWALAAVLAVLTVLSGVLFLNADLCADPMCAAPNRWRAIWAGVTVACGAACAIVLPLKRE